MAHRVGLYSRISEDVEGRALGVRRQEQDGRKLATKRGWRVVNVYTDNDVSAFKTKVVRPAFEQLLDDLEAGVLDGVVVYDLDRFARQPSDLERALRIFDSRPGLVFATVQSDIDLSSSDGRTMARVMVAFANKASMDTSRRVKRKHLELAQTGVPVGGNRPFGWKADRRTLEPKEARLIRKAAQQILAGVGLHTICREWNEAGIKTTVGNPWRRSVLKNMMTSPRLAGYRVYQGKIARTTEGEPVTGLFAPVLDVETWQAVCAVVTAPDRSRNVHIGGRKYLLTGVARCGVCSNFLSGNAATNKNTFYYSCRPATSSGRGCGKVACSGPSLDKIITKLVLDYLADREVQREREAWPGEDDLRAVTDRITELMAAYAKRDLSGDVVFPTVSKLEAEAAELREARRAWLKQQVVATHQPTNVVEAWPDLEVEQQRRVIEGVLQAVLIRPATKLGNRFDPDRAEPVWR